ncbi:MAG: hypothetical protein RLP15_13835 [Cryomorphaceae bacterium]
MKHSINILLFFLILLGSCKTYVEPSLDPIDMPIFYFEAVEGGTSLRMDAESGFVASSGYSVDSLGITFYSGSLVECSSCPASALLLWRASTYENPSLLATVGGENPSFRSPSSIKLTERYSVHLKAKPSSEAKSFKWNVNGSVYTEEEFTLEIDRDDARTFLPISLETEYANGCIASIDDTIFLPNFGCNCRVKSEDLGQDQYLFTAIKTAASAVQYLWRFESGASANSREVKYAFGQTPADGTEEITLRTDVNGCTSSAKYQQHFPAVPNSCAINFEIDIKTDTIAHEQPQGFDLNTITIEYLNGDGQLYSSALIQQDDASYLQVLNIEEYTDPSLTAASKAVRVTGEFNCKLSNGLDSIRLSGGSFSFPIGEGAK